MHPAAGGGETGRNEEPHQRLTLARGHINDPATQHAHCGKHLHFEWLQPEPSTRRLACDGKKTSELDVVITDRTGRF